MFDTGLPRLICLACPSNERQQRIEEIVNLGNGLGGRTHVEPLSPRTTALQIALPPDAARRLTGALALWGGVLADGSTDGAQDEIIVIVTADPGGLSGQ